MAQRKMVELGRAVGRLVSMNMTIDLGHTGFNQEMVSNSSWLSFLSLPVK